MLSNAYFLAKFRFDTAEKEPAKKLQNLYYLQNCTLTPGRGAERLAMRVVSAFLAYASARASMDTSSMEAIV